MTTSEQATTAEAPPGEALTAAETSEASSDAATSGDQHKLDVFSEAMPCGVGAESRPSLHVCFLQATFWGRALNTACCSMVQGFEHKGPWVLTIARILFLRVYVGVPTSSPLPYDYDYDGPCARV